MSHCVQNFVYREYYLDRVEQSADFNGAAQIDIQAKKIFMGHLYKSIKVQSCQKPNKNDMLSMSIYFVSQK